jgi:hypothetical protein
LEEASLKKDQEERTEWRETIRLKKFGKEMIDLNVGKQLWC